MENIRKRFGQEHHGWSGYEDISGSFYGRMEKSAKKRGIEWNLTRKYLWDLFLKQNKRCNLSGIELKMPIQLRKLAKHDKNIASLDRIDSNKGYIEGNVQWVSIVVNYMKFVFSQEDFFDFIKRIYKYTIERKEIE